MTYDITIIGAGIVGLATGLKILEKNPGLRLCILEKETEIAQHQSGHNSGVIHSGIYYKPGSLRATNCQRGYRYLLDFCEKHNVQHELCGKIIIATREWERPILENILQRGIANGMQGLRKISKEEALEKEPHVNAVEAVWVPQAGIVHYPDVAQKIAQLIKEKGGEILTDNEVKNVEVQNKKSIIETQHRAFASRILVNCTGLYADKLALMTEQKIHFRILPFRGEYYELKKEKEQLVNNLIYPVPNPEFPFLGVHYTRMIKGGIEAGPNAVLAFSREGYSRWDVNWRELGETLFYPGFRKIAAKFWRTGLGEMKRSYSKKAFVKALQHLIPEIGMNDLKRGGSGVRAMACDDSGNLLDDYLILESPGVVNVCNAPSPAATSCLSIGETVAKKVLKQF
ncbi:MAG: L-2-hydroxyglutarate oxidase [Bacteroidetes bacterium]|nr:L-2-hydroxyglutarate oxidase [Bacteroidota bacterium]